MASPMVQWRMKDREKFVKLQALALRNECTRSEIAERMVDACLALNDFSEDELAAAERSLRPKADRKLLLVLPEPDVEPVTARSTTRPAQPAAPPPSEAPHDPPRPDPADRLSSESAELLVAMLQHPDMAGSIKDRLVKIPRLEMNVVMDRLLERARQEQEWGTPPILDACLAVVECDPSQSVRLLAFLRERPSSQIQPSIVPKIADYGWAKTLFVEWEQGDVASPVKAAIKRRKSSGHVSI